MKFTAPWLSLPRKGTMTLRDAQSLAEDVSAHQILLRGQQRSVFAGQTYMQFPGHIHTA